MRNSKQRDTILKIVMESNDHPTADMVYARARAHINNISLGTVYRNLNTLSEKGIIRKISMPNHCDRFDKTVHEHFHIYCIKCDKLEDVNYSIKNTVYKKIEQEQNYKILSCDLVFEGICNDCIEGNE